MKNIKSLLLWMGILLFSLNALEAQENNPPRDSKIKFGFISGYGDQSLFEVNYHYRLVFFQPQFYYSLVDKSSWSIEILTQPQYSITRFRQVNTIDIESNGYEFGVNAGLLARKQLFNELMSVYMLISAGPHYVSGAPDRQSSGFIFSDNFFIDVTVKLHDAIHLDLRPGVRHISNAGLQNPNGGVNNFVWSGGIMYTLE